MTTPQATGIPCPACNAELAPDTRFCIHCGASVAGVHGNVATSGPRAYPPPAYASANYAFACQTCGGDGSKLPLDKVYCAGCRWLRPLGPSYALDVDAFMWQLDAEAMRVLRSLGPITTIAHSVSERVGRPWFEASVNGLRLSERQLPDIFAQAIRAARIVGLPHLPELYISGDQMWDAATLGTESSAFIVLGSVLTNFKPDELLFILGREMGHVRAGHALWKTVMQFVSGRSHRRSIMGDGVLKMLNPAKIVESAIDAPLMAWSRHSEITADRAGLLVVGSETVARRVLMSWTLKSFPLQSRINPDAWQEQEDQSDQMTQVAEWTLASTPYLAGRLRLLREFAKSESHTGWRRIIEHWAPPPPPPPAPTSAPPPNAGAQRTPAAPPPPDPNSVRLVCVKCKEGMRIPKSALESGETVNVRCPNPACRSVLTVKTTKKAADGADALQPPAPPTPPAGDADPSSLSASSAAQD